MICDINVSELSLINQSPNGISLSCGYSNEALNCNFINLISAHSLRAGDYNVYNSNEIFHNINIIKCPKDKSKFDSVTGECYYSCKDSNKKYSYNNECLSQCPSYTGEIHFFCLDSIEVNSSDESTITVTGDTNELYHLILENFEDFTSINKTIVGKDFALQLYKADEPIKDSSYSSIDTKELENAIKSSNSSLLNEDLYVIKIDTLNSSSITNQVDFGIYTSTGTEIDKSVFSGVIVDISLPINENVLDLSLAETMFITNIDIYNASDSFFNDICTTFDSGNGTDAIISDRRSEIYQNE